ncbi:hypothetical protein ACFQJC_02525 [Haloferax namakaokahaiae]|uniref:Uncharacterized protein n=1 Tax=Haloferax namakaokahaiae TaxID=1748331 RepID=A0ABD5ZBF9_9EURY
MTDRTREETVGPSRRSVLAGIGSAALGGLAGCTGGGGSQIQDTDGDGVIDSEDYAPRDPSVSRRSDLESTTQAAKTTTATTTTQVTTTESPTATPTPEPTTASTTVASEDVEGLTARNPAVFDRRNHIVSYSQHSVTVRLWKESVEGYSTKNSDLYVSLAEFPRAGSFASGRTSVEMGNSNSTSVTVDIDVPEEARDETLHYLAFFVPEGESIDSLSSNDVTHVGESDPFTLQSGASEIARVTPDELAGLESEATDEYVRTNAEGVFDFTIYGRTNGQNWEASYYIFKSAYAAAWRRDHGRSRPEFVQYEMQNGFAAEFADLLDGIAEDIGFTDKRMKVEFVIDFVQRLPYVPDSVSTGYDDFTKFSIETLVELGGDCEDTSIMLAGILQSEPFGYDMVLIQPPGHMAVGIYGDDLPGYYWTYEDRKYYYIETTGEGWGIGDLPNEYRDASAYVIQV